MRRLGELLLEKGAIAISELHTALEACHRTGGRLGTQLLRFGFVDERALLDALSEQYGVPSVPEAVLLQASLSVLRTLPADAQRRLQAVPFERVHNRLRVAMIHPRNPAALEELGSLTELAVEPYVATENAVLRLLAEVDGGQVGRTALPEDAAATPPDVGWWDRLWTPPRVGAHELFDRRSPVRLVRPRVLMATFPDLVPVVGVTLAESELLDEPTFVERLKEVHHRDEVGELLVRFASRYLSRVCLFAVHRRRVVGWMARGQAVVVDDVQSVEISLDESPLLQDLADSGRAYIGPVPAASESLLRALSDPPPLEVAVVPVRVKERTVALLMGDNPGELSLAVPLGELQLIANRAGVAFEILILKTKIEA